MKVQIVIDSTADVADHLRGRFVTLPLTIQFGDQSFTDGVDLSRREFYERLVESDVMPTTSQATPYDFSQCFRKIVEAGDCAVALTLSSKLSGTFQSAMIAAQEYPGRIFVVDSKTAAIGSGILAERAIQMVDSGMDAQEIAARLEKERDEVCLVALLDTLEYLRRGGRISRTAAVAGEILSIKPVICLRDGAVELLGKARGSRRGNYLLVQEIERAGGVNFEKPVMLGYTGLSDVLLQKYVQDSAALWKDHAEALRVAMVGGVVGTHAGPGAIAVAFFRGAV